MNKVIGTSYWVATALSLLSGIANATDADNLLGCWRTQHVEQVMSDKKVVHLNSDCVSDFSETQYRTECRFQNTHYSSTYTYRITSPGKMVITMISSSARQSLPATPREIDYAVDGDWLTITAIPPHMSNATENVIEKINSLFVRVIPANQTDKSAVVAACSPKGASNLRNSHGPISSLNLNIPDGYEPLHADPASNPDLASAINSNFLIGQFVPHSASQSVTNIPGAQAMHVLVVEDYRSGARPVKSADFNTLKEQLKTELGNDRVSCENQKVICFDMHDPLAGKTVDTRYMTTEYVNVKGRVAIIYGSASGTASSAKKLANQMADTFAERLLNDNP